MSVQADRMCVYLDVTQLPRDVLDQKLAGILDIYERFQGADPRTTPMKIFPAVHYSMGGLWCDYEANGDGGLRVGSPRNQQTNVPGLFAIGECDYQFHGANRLGANSLVACIFSGLTVAPGVVGYVDGLAARRRGRSAGRALRSGRRQASGANTRPCWRGPTAGRIPIALHAELGRLMTKIATVVRHNAELDEGYGKICEMEQAARSCSLADTGEWANQDVVFVRALQDMFPLAKTIVKGRGCATSAAGRTTSRSSPCRASMPPSRPNAAGRPRRGAGGSRRTTASG